MTAFSILDKMVETYVSQLAEETDAVRKSQFFREYLDTMANFWHYSYHNQILIHVQKKDASRVAGFRKWNELDRFVKKGSKAIKILAPYSKKVKEKDALTGEEKEVIQTYFWPVNVFDVSQTDGKDLPKIDIEIEGNEHKLLLDKILAYCASCNIAIEFKELGINGLYGYSQGGKIAIDTKQGINMQVNTLVHEIAHELLHQNIDGKKFSKNEKELQAESVSYVVCKNFGLTPKSPNYLALYKASKEKILENLKTISNTSKKILEDLNTE